MLKTGKIYEIEITDLGHTGEGIGRAEGITVFIEGALKGDKVKAKITKSKKNYAVADLVSITIPSSDRVVPVCPVAHICGGCQIMQLDYQKQLEIKKDSVIQNLTRIGKIDSPKVLDTLGMEHPYNYRNKAQIPVGLDENHEPILGFYKKNTHDIVPIATCYVQDKLNDTVIKTVKDYIKKYSVSVYDEKSHTGNLRQVITKKGYHTDQIMVILVTAKKELPFKNEIIEILTERLPNIRTIVQNINPDKTNVIMGRTNNILYGDGIIEDTINDLIFEISPHSFYQVNPKQTKVLYDKALELADISNEDTVFDIYCGIGTISLLLAKKAKHVYGIEIVEQAIDNAKVNAKKNNIDNVSFYAGKAETLLPKLYEEGIRADVVVVDPPRKGCDETVLKTIADIQPKRIVYVSCNPSTLARDVAILTEYGYKMEIAQPVDMFPHTMHVETVCLLSR